ncbi:hypothetical protein L6164_030213 [Bauhinia variegata]|nr:hypothetical protein L6164_030213 [Bauhinia variegata]
MVGCTLASGLSFGATARSVVTTLCFFRFWLGFGIGGDYPLSAVIMSEYANQKTRGGFIAAVFAMQGFGILFAGGVAYVFSKIFLDANPAPDYETYPVLSTQPAGDFLWRIVLMFGAIPAALTYYWRMKMPETARYTALVEGNHHKAAADMAKVLDTEIAVEESGSRAAVDMVKVLDINIAVEEAGSGPAANPNPSPSYGFLSSEFINRHGLHLLGTTSTWFLLDIAFYSLQLAQKDIYPATGYVDKASKMNAIEEVHQLSKAMLVVALLATVPGYWFTVFLIDNIGRFKIQLGGFLLMSISMWFLGKNYEKYRGEKENCHSDSKQDYCGGDTTMFLILFGVTLFFANFGPNSTTFIVPAELFPARFRSTCHGISAAAGKAGAIIGAFVVQSYAGDSTSGIKTAIKALAIVNFLGFLFTFLVPETNGRSLENISGENVELASKISPETANEKKGNADAGNSSGSVVV